jgi:phenylpropionate dioxygenase-like ring-hydroxylating dioxygenase large terminal subunit
MRGARKRARMMYQPRYTRALYHRYVWDNVMDIMHPEYLHQDTQRDA